MLLDEALAQYISLSKAQRPEESRLEIINSNLLDERMKDYLNGPDAETWKATNSADLVNLDEVYKFDRITTWLVKALLHWYHKLVGRQYKSSTDPEVGIYSYKEDHLEAPVVIFSTVMSALLPIVAIVALYIVKSMPIRLAITAVFTAVFSLVLALLTKANRVENFAATAA